MCKIFVLVDIKVGIMQSLGTIKISKRLIVACETLGFNTQGPPL